MVPGLLSGGQSGLLARLSSVASFRSALIHCRTAPPRLRSPRRRLTTADFGFPRRRSGAEPPLAPLAINRSLMVGSVPCRLRPPLASVSFTANVDGSVQLAEAADAPDMLLLLPAFIQHLEAFPRSCLMLLLFFDVGIRRNSIFWLTLAIPGIVGSYLAEASEPSRAET